MNPIYRVIHSDGRVYIPKAVRESANVGFGDVMELRAGKGKISLVRARIAPNEPDVDDILEMLESIPKARLFEATAKLMSVPQGGE